MTQYFKHILAYDFNDEIFLSHNALSSSAFINWQLVEGRVQKSCDNKSIIQADPIKTSESGNNKTINSVIPPYSIFSLIPLTLIITTSRSQYGVNPPCERPTKAIACLLAPSFSSLPFRLPLLRAPNRPTCTCGTELLRPPSVQVVIDSIQTTPHVVFPDSSSGPCSITLEIISSISS